jgi:predicted NUDIX family NTP pyrophosphohydrolase
MAILSAGIILYETGPEGLRMLLVHPGGPFWSKRDLGAWSIPKGEYAADEPAEDAARRELAEETGLVLTKPLIALGEARQPSGKRITAFAVEAKFDVATLRSNRFDMEWPPKSGQTTSFPEVDRAAWFSIPDARQYILPGQAIFLNRLLTAMVPGVRT